MSGFSSHPLNKAQPSRRAIIGWLVVSLAIAVGQVGYACTPRLPGSPPSPAIESIYLAQWQHGADEPNGQAKFRVLETYFGPVRETFIVKRVAAETLEAAIGQDMVIGLNAPADGTHEVHAIGGCYPLFSTSDQIPDGQLEALVQVLEDRGAQ